MHKSGPVLENETHEIFWDLEIQTDHHISTRRPDQVLTIKKKALPRGVPCRSGLEYTG